MSNQFLYLDIETIPTQDPEAGDKLVADAKPPANYKTDEAIAKWRDGKREELIAKTSFDGGRGHVCAISWAFDDGPIESLLVRGQMGKPFNEREVLAAFFASLDPYHSVTIVGHYVGGFDIKFLTQRAICLGVRLPPVNVWPRDVKPWGKEIFDTMTAWAGARDTIGLDALCDILGIPGKGDFSGADVAGAWARGEYQRISDYCAEDVERVRAVHKRFQAVGF